MPSATPRIRIGDTRRPPLIATAMATGTALSTPDRMRSTRYAKVRGPMFASAGPALTYALGPPISGASIARAPASSAFSGRSRSPLNHAAPRVKCHADAIANPSAGASTSWPKNTALGSVIRCCIVTMR